MKEDSMKVSRLSLNRKESQALLNIRMGEALDRELRPLAGRLIYLGLVDETAKGLRVTPVGADQCLAEAARRGLLEAPEAD
jgi:hypothetical protein